MKRKALGVLLANAHYMVLNMNDTFDYATADVGGFDLADLDRAAPIIAEYGEDALTAYVSLSRGGVEPIKQLNTPGYRAALARFQALREEEPDFCRLPEWFDRGPSAMESGK